MPLGLRVDIASLGKQTKRSHGGGGGLQQPPTTGSGAYHLWQRTMDMWRPLALGSECKARQSRSEVEQTLGSSIVESALVQCTVCGPQLKPSREKRSQAPSDKKRLTSGKLDRRPHRLDSGTPWTPDLIWVSGRVLLAWLVCE